MKIKTSELTGAALDWAVAKANGEEDIFWVDWAKEAGACYSPSGFWAQGGPIIEREEISTNREFASSRVEWAAWTPAPIRDEAEAFGYGSTPLIAAMRCYVESKLGEEIEIPEELL